MFGMGLTLNLSDFKEVWFKRKLVLLGVLLQYIIMPLLAIGISLLFRLPQQALIGMVLVGACPGGTASNVIAYLARANVPLSIVLTFTSTALAPLLTPAIVYLLLHKSIELPFLLMIQTIFLIVTFPLVAGITIRHFFRKRLDTVISVFPSLSIIAITLVIACIMALNQKNIFAFPLLVILSVILHNLGGLTLGYYTAKLFRANEQDARTLAIEVGMQNSGLAVALATKFFSAGAALAGAIFSLWHNLSGITLARIWRRRVLKCET